MKKTFVKICSLALGLCLAALTLTACGGDSGRPVTRVRPAGVDMAKSLSRPAEVLDVVDVNLSNSRYGIFAANVLQGVINKKQPRVYIANYYNYSERFGPDGTMEAERQRVLAKYGDVSFQKMDVDAGQSHSRYSMFWTIFKKYSAEIKRIYVFSEESDVRDNINVAAMLAGRNNGVAVNRELCDQILAAGYTLPVIDVVEYCGFTGDKANTFAINRWISDNMVTAANKNVVFCLFPGGRDDAENGAFPEVYDLPVAIDAVIYWVMPDINLSLSIQKELLDQYDDLVPVVGWPGMDQENVYVESITKNGKLVSCADWSFNNGSVWTAYPEYIPPAEKASPVKDTVPLESDKVYVAFMQSDGDGWHNQQRETMMLWADPDHGKQPMAWTFPTSFYSISPLMIEHYYDTMSVRDEMIQGPSGIGYIYPNDMPKGAYEKYLSATEDIFKKMNVNMVNVWDIAEGDNSMVGDLPALIDRYAKAVPSLDAIFLGHDSRTGGYRMVGDTVVIEEMGNNRGAGARSAQDILDGIDRVTARTATGKPTFVLVNVETWFIGPREVNAARGLLDARADGAKYKFVKPSELVSLIRRQEAAK